MSNLFWDSINGLSFYHVILVVDRHSHKNMHVNSWQSEFRTYLKCEWDASTQNVNVILSRSEIGYYTGTTLTSSSSSRNQLGGEKYASQMLIQKYIGWPSGKMLKNIRQLAGFPWHMMTNNSAKGNHIDIQEKSPSNL